MYVHSAIFAKISFADFVKNLIELNLRKKYGFNIVAIKKGEKVNVNINPEQPLEEETTLIVIANIAKLGKIK